MSFTASPATVGRMNSTLRRAEFIRLCYQGNAGLVVSPIDSFIRFMDYIFHERSFQMAPGCFRRALSHALFHGGKTRPAPFDQGLLPHRHGLLPRGNPWTVYWVHFQGASTRIFIHHLGYREGEPVQDAGISPSLIASFTSLMGVRRTGYSDRACLLLDSSELSVKAIAAELGYEDQLYFSRLFSKTIGQSPLAYRASIRR